MKFRFQSFVDISTSASSMQVIQWSVGGAEVLKRCRHLFGAYKYFKLGKISVKMVPASTLPVDPLGLSYGDTDPQTVDPRDQMNPGLVRITNGEDIFTDVSSLTEEKQMAVYNAMMLDPRWSKFMLQSGFRRSAYPMYWQVGQLHQDKYPGATVNVPGLYDTNLVDYDIPATFKFAGTTQTKPDVQSGNSNARKDFFTSSARGLFQIGHRGKLGFLPTDCYQEVPTSGSTTLRTEAGVNNIPEVSVITCVLPKAYKTLYYYRVFITEEVIFSGLRSAPVDGYQGIDQFLLGAPAYLPPGTSHSISGSVLDAMNNGGDLP